MSLKLFHVFLKNFELLLCLDTELLYWIYSQQRGFFPVFGLHMIWPLMHSLIYIMISKFELNFETFRFLFHLIFKQNLQIIWHFYSSQDRQPWLFLLFLLYHSKYSSFIGLGCSIFRHTLLNKLWNQMAGIAMSLFNTLILTEQIKASFLYAIKLFLDQIIV